MIVVQYTYLMVWYLKYFLKIYHSYISSVKNGVLRKKFLFFLLFKTNNYGDFFHQLKMISTRNLSLKLKIKVFFTNPKDYVEKKYNHRYNTSHRSTQYLINIFKIWNVPYTKLWLASVLSIFYDNIIIIKSYSNIFYIKYTILQYFLICYQLIMQKDWTLL